MEYHVLMLNGDIYTTSSSVYTLSDSVVSEKKVKKTKRSLGQLSFTLLATSITASHNDNDVMPYQPRIRRFLKLLQMMISTTKKVQ